MRVLVVMLEVVCAAVATAAAPVVIHGGRIGKGAPQDGGSGWRNKVLGHLMCHSERRDIFELQREKKVYSIKLTCA